MVTRGYCDVYCLTEEIAQGIFQLYPVVHACLNYIFRDRNLDIVLSEEVGTINDKIQAYLQEKQEEFTLASEVRALAVAEDERVAMLADVILASPRSSVVTAELEQVQSEIATTQNHLRKLLDQRQKLIATSAQTEDKASPAEAGVEPSKNDEQPLEQAARPTLQTPEVLEVVEAKCGNDTQIESPDTPKTIAANESTQF